MLRPVTIAMLLLLATSGCASDRVKSNPAAAQFTVTDDVITRDFVGFGGEMNPYLYCRPNLVGSPATQPAQGAVNEQNVAELERRVIELAPQHVRIFVLLHWWSPGGDYEIAKGDPRMVESFLRTVRLAQRAGATVNLTLWYGPWTQPDQQARQFARLLDDLINRQGLACIRYVTIQNEPNSTKLTFAKYQALYAGLDDELRKLGLRDRINIVSGDLLAEDQQKWFDEIATNLAQVSDGYSIHVYWDFWNPNWPVKRLTDVRRIVDAMAPEQRRALYVTEFGMRGRRPRDDVEPGWFDDGTPVADDARQAVQIVHFDLLALNLGYVATVQWELYDAWYDRLMPYGVMGDATTGWKRKPMYELLRLLTHTTRPGWQVLRVDGSSDDVITAAMRSADGSEMTVLALNSTEQSQRINIDGVAPQQSLHLLTCDANGSCGSAPLRRGVAQRSRRIFGAYHLTLPPRTLAALTTLNWSPD